METNDSKNQASALQTKLINYRTYNFDKTNVIPIDRRSGLGNPFEINKNSTREDVIEKYRKYFYTKLEHNLGFKNSIKELKGKTLGCWCRPEEGFKGRLLCHGQIIIAYLEGCKPEEVE
jgi:hypothetical protein